MPIGKREPCGEPECWTCQLYVDLGAAGTPAVRKLTEEEEGIACSLSGTAESKYPKPLLSLRLSIETLQWVKDRQLAAEMALLLEAARENIKKAAQLLVAGRR